MSRIGTAAQYARLNTINRNPVSEKVRRFSALAALQENLKHTLSEEDILQVLDIKNDSIVRRVLYEKFFQNLPAVEADRFENLGTNLTPAACETIGGLVSALKGDLEATDISSDEFSTETHEVWYWDYYIGNAEHHEAIGPAFVIFLLLCRHGSRNAWDDDDGRIDQFIRILSRHAWHSRLISLLLSCACKKVGTRQPSQVAMEQMREICKTMPAHT